jgi:hypothetical protein
MTDAASTRRTSGATPEPRVKTDIEILVRYADGYSSVGDGGCSSSRRSSRRSSRTHTTLTVLNFAQVRACVPC